MDFTARRNSDLILQEAAPGLCFVTDPGTMSSFCASAAVISRSANDTIVFCWSDFYKSDKHCMRG